MDRLTSGGTARATPAVTVSLTERRVVPCPNCGSRVVLSEQTEPVCAREAGGCGAGISTAEWQTELRTWQREIVYHVQETHFPEADHVDVEFECSGTGLRDPGARSYLVVEPATGERRFLKIYRDPGDCVRVERDALTDDMAPLDAPELYDSGDRWLLMEHVDGQPLMLPTQVNDPAEAVVTEVVEQLATWHDNHVTRFEPELDTFSTGLAHDDFVPFNVVVDDGDPVVIDWEYRQTTKQAYDILHFASIAGVGLVDGDSPADTFAKMRRSERHAQFVERVFETYADRRPVSVERLDAAWGEYAAARLDRLHDRAGDATSFYPEMRALDWTDESMLPRA